jgi:putative endonuclease
MFTVYVIRSASGIRYIGYTEDLTKRLGQHNSGMSKYTSRDSDWRLVYKEEYHTRAEAMRREKWLKSGLGREFLNRIENELISGS